MKYLFAIILFLLQFSLSAQDNAAIQKVYVNENVSTHFVCSEPVQYIDISTDRVVGDMPLSNMVRIRPKALSDKQLGVVTIVAQQYLIQYQMIYASIEKADKQVFVNQMDGSGLQFPERSLSYDEMRSFASRVLQIKTKKPVERNRRYGIEAKLNQIYTVGDYFLVDLSFQNKTNIPYQFDQLRFKIEDRKIAKATNVQSIEIEPEFQFYQQNSFRKQYRNVYVFKKFTFPNKKIFTIELSEQQISGRNIKLKIDYKDVLNADVL